jgi:uncharacterized membrane protein
MKPTFTDQPDFWLRTKRTGCTAAEYASPVTRFTDRGHRFVTRWSCIGLCVLVALLLVGAL